MWTAADEPPMFTIFLTCFLWTALDNLEGKVVTIADG